jgi:hypothetical protein
MQDLWDHVFEFPHTEPPLPLQNAHTFGSMTFLFN